MEKQIFKIEELEERLELSAYEMLADNGICWNQEKEQQAEQPA